MLCLKILPFQSLLRFISEEKDGFTYALILQTLTYLTNFSLHNVSIE